LKSLIIQFRILHFYDELMYRHAIRLGNPLLRTELFVLTGKCTFYFALRDTYVVICVLLTGKWQSGDTRYCRHILWNGCINALFCAQYKYFEISFL